MRKFWKYFKRAVAVWGWFSLGFVLFVTGWVWVEATWPAGARSQQAGPSAAVSTPVRLMDRRFGEMRLTVEAAETGGERDALRLSLFRQGQALVRDFVLPTGELDLDGTPLRDARLIPLGQGAYRIVLFSSSVEHETGAEQQIWFLKFDGTLRMVKRLQLSGMSALDEQRTQFLGSAVVSLPAISEDDASIAVAIPTRLSVGADIRITPLLSPQVLAMMRSHYGRIIDARLERASRVDMSPELLDSYMAATGLLDESLTSRTIPY